MKSKTQSLAVVSEPMDITNVLKLRGLKNLNFLATTFKAKEILEKSKLPFHRLERPRTEREMVRIGQEAKVIADSIFDNPKISKIFTVEGVNILQLISNKFYFFLHQMILGYLSVNKIQKKTDNLNSVIISEKAFTNLGSFFNLDFIHLAFYFWAKIHKSIKLKLIGNVDSNKQIRIPDFFIKKINAIFNFLIYLKNGRANISRKIVFILPAAHAIQLTNLFNTLDKQKVNYLAVVHNLKINERVALLKKGITFIDRESLKNETITKKAKQISSAIRGLWQKEKSAVRILKHNGKKNLFLKEAIIHRINEFLKLEIRQVVGDFLIANKILHQYKPGIILTTTDPDPKVLPFIKAAQLKGIKTITIQHGTYVLATTVDFKSDEMFVWGRYYKNWFEKNLNKKSSQLIITGSPFFDNLRTESQIRIGPRKKYSVLILLAGIIHISIEKDLDKIIKGLKKARIDEIFVRTHPWQTIAMQKNMLATRKSLDFYLQRAQIVVTTNTTAGFEAFIKSKPLIYWHLKGSQYLPFRQAGVPVAESANQVINYVKSVKENKYQFLNKERHELTDEIFYKLDGKSSERITSYLSKIIT